jgi:methionine-rich copper-binding protein CopC
VLKTPIYVVALWLVASAALAHSELTASTPADKASIVAPPHELVLHFSEPVRLTALAVTRAGEARRVLDALPKERQKDFAVPSPGLAAGQYTVSWRALSDDAHVMTGEFTFAVGGSAPSGVAAGASHDAHAAGHAEHGAQH